MPNKDNKSIFIVPRDAILCPDNVIGVCRDTRQCVFCLRSTETVLPFNRLHLISIYQEDFLKLFQAIRLPKASRYFTFSSFLKTTELHKHSGLMWLFLPHSFCSLFGWTCTHRFWPTQAFRGVGSTSQSKISNPCSQVDGKKTNKKNNAMIHPGWSLSGRHRLIEALIHDYAYQQTNLYLLWC